ncbi:bacterial transcriptional activator domain-containing protein [Actinomycetes bacterium KLBMP 9797]
MITLLDIRAGRSGTDAIAVRCFAGFRMELAGQRLEWSRLRPRMRALLRLLAAAGGRPVHRESILAALWPNLPVPAGIRNLHVGISTLRAFLEPDVGRGESRLVRRDGECYLLAVPPDGCHDVRAFTDAVGSWQRAQARGDLPGAATALRQAVALYTGDLLPEDGPAEWVVAERDRYRLLAVQSAVALAALELDAGNYPEAVAVARRGIELDGCHDPAWRVLAEAHHRCGDRAAAAQTRSAYRAMLHSLGVLAA